MSLESHYRANVGSNDYGVIAATQAMLLLAAGLCESHQLVGVGCVSLQEGKLFISYLKRRSMKLDHPFRCLLSSIAREASERPTRRRQTREEAEVQYHCTTP
jgi:hypothetical protein